MHCQSYPWQGNFRLLLSRCLGPAGSRWGAIFSHLSTPASPAPAASPDWSWQTALPALEEHSQPVLSSRPFHLHWPSLASVLLHYCCSFSTPEHLVLTLPPAITQHGNFLCPWFGFWYERSRLKSQNPCIKDAPSWPVPRTPTASANQTLRRGQHRTAELCGEAQIQSSPWLLSQNWKNAL